MNPTKEQLELMHAVLDGEASPADRAALDALLAADPAARREFDALGAFFDVLKRTPAPRVPAGLPQRIASQVQPRPAARRQTRTALYRYAACVAGGALLATLVYPLVELPESANDVMAVAGSMVSNPARSGGSVVRPDVPGINGDLTLRRAEGLLVLSVALTSDRNLALVLPLDGALRVVGVVGIDGNPPDLALQDGRMQVRQSGQQGYAVLLQGDAGVVSYELYQGDVMVHRGSISEPGNN